MILNVHLIALVTLCIHKDAQGKGVKLAETSEGVFCCVLCWSEQIFCRTVWQITTWHTEEFVCVYACVEEALRALQTSSSCHILLSTLLDLMNIQYFYSCCITLHILRKCVHVCASHQCYPHVNLALAPRAISLVYSAFSSGSVPSKSFVWVLSRIAFLFFVG